MAQLDLLENDLVLPRPELIVAEHIGAASLRLFDSLRLYEIADIEYASRGLAASDVAGLSGTVPNTIDHHRSRIIHKLGARNMVHVVRLACEVGLFQEHLPLRPITPFSPTQLAHFSLASFGHQNTEVAEALGVSRKTVDTHRELAKRKLGAINMANAVRIAFEAGILPITKRI